MHAERLTSNVRGKMGKTRLNRVKVDQIKETELRLWPTEPRENEKEAWDRCVVAFDEMNRRLKKAKSNN